MPRELDGYRQQLERLAEIHPNKEMLTMQEVCKIVGCQARTLLADKTFPVKRIGKRGKYSISITSLARWMVAR